MSELSRTYMSTLALLGKDLLAQPRFPSYLYYLLIYSFILSYSCIVLYNIMQSIQFMGVAKMRLRVIDIQLALAESTS